MITATINASIITVGNELLIGQTIDTNSAWMAQELSKIGIWVRRRVAVGDVWDDIWNALDEESKKADIIFITGGLGPTADDITKPLLCKYFGGKLVKDKATEDHIIDIFTKLNRPVINRNLKQAEVPDVCTVLFNKRGTAPGMWFEKPHQTSPKGDAFETQTKKIFISLPGVPYEMKGIMTNYVIPKLPEHFQLPYILHRTLLTAGQGESFLAEMLMDFEAELPAHIKMAYLPNYGMVKLRLITTGTEKYILEKDLDTCFSVLKEKVKDILVTDSDIGLEVVLGSLLKEKRKTVSTAESCTGGYIAHLITSVAGSSAYYKGSVVSYANDTKVNVLGVQNETLANAGAVSEKTVKEMVKGVLQQMNADFAVATSGIMGPGGIPPTAGEKPVGTVWIAVGDNKKIEAQKFYFRFDRSRNIEMTAQAALNMLRKFIMEN